jgi:hypothetical protein
MDPYIERILGYLGEQDPITVLETTPRQLEALFERMTPYDLEQSYGEGKWTTREILAHLADVEITLGFRIRQTVAQPKSPLPLMDQDGWARRYARLEPSIAIEAFRAQRAWNLALFSTLSFDDWLAEGIHAERGAESVDLMVRFLAGHDLNHLRQLEQILQS